MYIDSEKSYEQNERGMTKFDKPEICLVKLLLKRSYWLHNDLLLSWKADT